MNPLPIPHSMTNFLNFKDSHPFLIEPMIHYLANSLHFKSFNHLIFPIFLILIAKLLLRVFFIRVKVLVVFLVLFLLFIFIFWFFFLVAMLFFLLLIVFRKIVCIGMMFRRNQNSWHIVLLHWLLGWEYFAWGIINNLIIYLLRRISWVNIWFFDCLLWIFIIICIGSVIF